MTNEDIKKRISLLPPIYQAYMTSDMPGVITQTFSEAHNLNSRLSSVFENGVMLYLLFFISKNEFANFISIECGINKDASIMLSNAVYLALPSEIKAIYNQISEATFRQENSDPTNILFEISETEAQLKNIHEGSLSPFRTMDSDSKQVGYSSNEETTYTSTQSAIINESK
jgi:hypothetical protein